MENYFSLNIKYLRNLKKLSQEKLAEELGLNRGNISSYESGTEPEMKVIFTIAKYFNISVDKLFNKNLILPNPFLEDEDEDQKVTESKRHYTVVSDESPTNVPTRQV